MNKPTVTTNEGLKVWVDFDYDWDDDIGVAIATGALVEDSTGKSWSVDANELSSLVDVEAVEEHEADGMNLIEYHADAGDYYEDR